MIYIILYIILGVFFAVFLVKKAEYDYKNEESTKRSFLSKLWYEDAATGAGIVAGFIWIIAIPIYFLAILSEKIAVKILTKQNKPN